MKWEKGSLLLEKQIRMERLRAFVDATKHQRVITDMELQLACEKEWEQERETLRENRKRRLRKWFTKQQQI